MERELSYLFKPGFPLAPVNLDHVPVGHLFDPLKVIHLVNDQASPYTDKKSQRRKLSQVVSSMEQKGNRTGHPDSKKKKRNHEIILIKE